MRLDSALRQPTPVKASHHRGPCAAAPPGGVFLTRSEIFPLKAESQTAFFVRSKLTHAPRQQPDSLCHHLSLCPTLALGPVGLVRSPLSRGGGTGDQSLSPSYPIVTAGGSQAPADDEDDDGGDEDITTFAVEPSSPPSKRLRSSSSRASGTSGTGTIMSEPAPAAGATLSAGADSGSGSGSGSSPSPSARSLLQAARYRYRTSLRSSGSGTDTGPLQTATPPADPFVSRLRARAQRDSPTQEEREDQAGEIARARARLVRRTQELRSRAMRAAASAAAAVTATVMSDAVASRSTSRRMQRRSFAARSVGATGPPSGLMLSAVGRAAIRGREAARERRAAGAGAASLPGGSAPPVTPGKRRREYDRDTAACVAAREWEARRAVDGRQRSPVLGTGRIVRNNAEARRGTAGGGGQFELPCPILLRPASPCMHGLLS